MDSFDYKDGVLYCEDVSVDEIAQRFGTPLYVYSRDTLIDHFARFAKAFEAIDPLVCFSVKALSNMRLLAELGRAGAGIDTVSGGELHRAITAGVDVDRIVFAGVGKSEQELRTAVAAGIRSINVESEAELELLSAIAAEEGRRPRVAIRVNPDVAPGDRTPAKTTTGTRGNKFGVDIEDAADLFERATRDENLEMDGVHIHLGSPIFLPEVYGLGIDRVLALVADLAARGVKVNTINIGGGYAAEYESDSAPSWDDYAAVICPKLQDFVDAGGKVVMEPGRTIAANSASLLTTVLYVKKAGDNNVAVVDAGMSHFVRTAIYGSSHFIWPVKPADGLAPESRDMPEEGPGLTRYDVAGPICESSDYLGKARMLPGLKRGDVLCVFSTGAYGMTMASNYNSQPRPAEVLVDGDDAFLIRRRETYEDLIALEMPDDGRL